MNWKAMVSIHNANYIFVGRTYLIISPFISTFMSEYMCNSEVKGVCVIEDGTMRYGRGRKKEKSYFF